MASHLDLPYEFADLGSYSFRQRLIIRVVGLLSYLLIRLIGSTIRFETIGLENFASVAASNKLPIYCFWHDRMIAGTYFFRNRGIIVLSSTSFDSEYTARFIQRFGYGVIKGSSTSGPVRALAGMIRMMKQGRAMAFTADGPKGPRYVTKPGSVLLAKKSGNPIVPFVVECSRYWTINSWDRLQVPQPFTRAAVIVGDPIYVDRNAGEDEFEAKTTQLQASLDTLVARGSEWRGGN